MVNDHTIAVVALTQGSTTSRASNSGTSTSQSSSPAPGDSQKEGKKGSSDTFRMAQGARGEASSTAQVENPKTPEKEAEQLQEVVVTAEKRESTVQHTPISLTAVSGIEIQERGVVGLYALAQSIPSVSVRTSGPGQTEFEMRGIASTGGDSPTVGFYLDDISLTAPATTTNGKVVIDPNLYDLNRVEVLRGPQGTLYGSGSMGGTIKVVTNPPNPAAFDASSEAILSGTDGGGFNQGVNAMLNVPFGGNTAALRIVGSESHTSGWIDRIVIDNGEFPIEMNPNGTINPSGTVRGNVLAAPVAVDHHNVNSTVLEGVRGSLLWTPTDRFLINASYFYQHISQNGASYIDSNPGTGVHYQPFDSAEPFSDNFNLGSLNFRYRFDAFDLTSTTARWTRDVSYHQDGSEEWQWALGLPSFYTTDGGIGPLSPTPYELDTSKQLSEEFRLTSSGATKFQWLFGYFYSDFISYQEAYFIAPGAAPLFGTSNLFSFIAPTTIIQQSFFGELSYQLTPQLKATVGARRYAYNEEVDQTEGGFTGPTGTDTTVTAHTSERSQGVNPKYNLSYEPSDHLLIYATAGKGFRPGGGTGPIPTSGSVVGDACERNLQSIYGTTRLVPSPLTFNPDSLWNYEIGEKWRALENRLVVNGAVYFADWKGIQQNIPLPCAYYFTANAGNAHIYGSEVEIQALLPKGFTLSLNGGYTHATLVSSNVIGVGVNVGSPVQQVPTWTTSQSIAYRHSMSDQLAFTARIENDYVGSRTDSTYSINQLPAYDLTSVRAGVEGGRWSATLFVTNVFNERALLNNVSMVSVNLPTYNRFVVSQPMTVGLDLNYRFGK